ncbi:isoprenoid biosynthesis glyoxalase ElbB [candidate division KSB1 bacterium]|nr:isoprenoid biosynthesis glyoxalase ElbB [candidate division KSB1 bacterium]
MKTVGVVLAGCGYLDGAEIYESVLTLLSLDRLGVAYQCLAPDLPQMHVVNHVSGDAMGESRRVLVEAARIARGKIAALDNSWVAKLDAVILPGGFGAAKNYCDFATKGEACSIQPVVESFMRAMVAARKPVGVICISPIVLARALKGTNVHASLTLGAQSSASAAAEAFGSKHVVCEVTDCVADHENLIVSTPAYMYSARIADVEIGIEKLVRQVVHMTHEATEKPRDSVLTTA